MKKISIFAMFMTLIMVVTSLGASVSALDWRDGVQAGHSFTYATADEGVAKVSVWDKNGTVSGDINTGDTVTVKAGSIVWRDSYLTATAFYVKNTVGYKTVKVLVNGVEGAFYDADEDLTIKATSTIGKSGTYTLKANSAYDDVFYFCRAGKEAWCKNASFEIVTEKITYNFVDESGKVIGNGTVNDAINLPTEGRWFLGETQITDGMTLTADMIKKADANNNITLKNVPVEPDLTDVVVTLHNDLSTNIATETVTLKDVEVGTNLDLSANEAVQQYISAGYKVAGDADYIVTVTEGMEVKLVKATAVSGSEWSTEYGIYLNSTDENIVRVDYESNSGIKGVDLKANEMLKFYTSEVGSNYKVTMSLFIKVANGFALDVSNIGDVTVVNSDAEGTIYKISYTRTGMHNSPENVGLSNTITLDLKTVPVEA